MSSTVLKLPGSESLALTGYRLNDAVAQTLILQTKEVYMNLSGPPFPFELSHAESWVNSIDDRLKEGADIGDVFTIRDLSRKSELYPDGQFIGAIGLSPYSYSHVVDLELKKELANKNAILSVDDPLRVWNIGFYLDPEYWSKGIMSKTLSVYFPYITSTTPVQMAQVVGQAFDYNIGSQKTFLKNGFHEVGIFKGCVPADERKGRPLLGLWNSVGELGGSAEAAFKVSQPL